MPIWRNSASMPKVRASSGMIGTMRLPISSWRRSLVSKPHHGAMVVDIECCAGAFEKFGVLGVASGTSSGCGA